MTDLVKRLRKGVMCGDDPIVEEAADRIEKLEAALHNIADVTEQWEDSLVSQVNEIARKALEGKND